MPKLMFNHTPRRVAIYAQVPEELRDYLANRAGTTGRTLEAVIVECLEAGRGRLAAREKVAPWVMELIPPVQGE